MRTVQRQAAGAIPLPDTSKASASPAVFPAPAFLRAPQVHEFVPRRRLVRRLIASRRSSLVLLAAPTGYGKTCLLSEWSEVDERPFAWVTLEASDNEVGQIAARIMQA